MAIPYSLSLRQVQPGTPEMGNKTFPLAQCREVLDLSAIAEHMSSHDSKYNKGDVMAVATQLTSCIREQLLLGNRVSLGDLGTFYVALQSKGANNAEEFSTAQIRKVKARWSPSEKFQNMITDATFEYVGTREAQAAARKAEKEALNANATVQPGEETPDSGGDTGGGNDDEGNLGD